MFRLSNDLYQSKCFVNALDEDGIVYLSEVRDRERLLDVATSLGTCVEPGVGMPSGVHDGRTYTVRPRNAGKGEVDRYGNVILSTTRLEFPLHTDAYNSSQPPHYVLLHRVDSTQCWVQSYISDAWQVLNELPEQMVSTLSSAVFPSAVGLRPLLETVGGRRRVRFNEREIENWSASSETEIGVAATRAMKAFSNALATRRMAFVIEPGDCLVIDNWRVCHGRSSIPADSERVLERIWVE